MNRLFFEIGCKLRVWKTKRAIRKYEKTSIKLLKTRRERIWIENNPHIHLLNYPYYKLKRLINKEDS